MADRKPARALVTELDNWNSSGQENTRPSSNAADISVERRLLMAEIEGLLHFAAMSRRKTQRMRDEADELEKRVEELRLAAEARDKVETSMESHAWGLSDTLRP